MDATSQSFLSEFLRGTMVVSRLCVRQVLRHGGGGAVEAVRWRDVRVGDVVKVEKDAFFPADLLFLAASSEEGSCYVETMNLDGETNLKVRRALDKTREVHNDLAR
jgi:phospholipid-translocating ATPase